MTQKVNEYFSTRTSWPQILRIASSEKNDQYRSFAFQRESRSGAQPRWKVYGRFAVRPFDTTQRERTIGSSDVDDVKAATKQNSWQPIL